MNNKKIKLELQIPVFENSTNDEIVLGPIVSHLMDVLHQIEKK